jgi:hypothetical protein
MSAPDAKTIHSRIKALLHGDALPFLEREELAQGLHDLITPYERERDARLRPANRAPSAFLRMALATRANNPRNMTQLPMEEVAPYALKRMQGLVQPALQQYFSAASHSPMPQHFSAAASHSPPARRARRSHSTSVDQQASRRSSGPSHVSATPQASVGSKRTRPSPTQAWLQSAVRSVARTRTRSSPRLPAPDFRLSVEV